MAPRQLESDEETIPDEAMLLFCDRGHWPTMVEARANRLGVNRRRIYEIYRSERDLCRATLRSCRKLVEERGFGPLETAEDPLAQLRRVFSHLEAFVDFPKLSSGCAAVNAVTHLAPYDRALAATATGHFAKIERAPRNAIARTQDLGQIDRAATAAERARLLLLLTQDFSVLSRSAYEYERVWLRSTTRSAQAVVKSWVLADPRRGGSAPWGRLS